MPFCLPLCLTSPQCSLVWISPAVFQIHEANNELLTVWVLSTVMIHCTLKKHINCSTPFYCRADWEWGFVSCRTSKYTRSSVNLVSSRLLSSKCIFPQSWRDKNVQRFKYRNCTHCYSDLRHNCACGRGLSVKKRCVPFLNRFLYVPYAHFYSFCVSTIRDHSQRLLSQTINKMVKGVSSVSIFEQSEVKL